MKRLLYLASIILFISCNDYAPKDSGWTHYHGDAGQTHYSALREIDTANVKGLQVAWTFNTGDADTAKFSQIQCNPIIIDSLIYLTSPTLQLFALRAADGTPAWSFNPDSLARNREFYQFILNNNRGVTYWTDGRSDRRIFYVAGSYLHCLDALTGQLISDFGNNGTIDLHDGLGSDAKDLFVTATSPGIVYRDLYIIGSRVDEGPRAAPGHIRAFDVRSGKQQWIFHTIPRPGEYGHDTWDDPDAWQYIGGANSWSGFTIDEQRGILYAPTGSASFDFYGGRRTGQNLFANCLLAIDAATGKRKWHFQFVHHDLWDMDVPTAPVLVTLKRAGKAVDAVVQTTKNGMIWIFDRETGEPLHPVTEMKVDTITELRGEKVWPTQPISGFSKPFVRQHFTMNDLNPYLPDSSIARLKQQLSQYRFGRMFIPPGKTTSVVLPGFDGGAEWGGPAVDPQTGMLYVNANEMGWLLTIRENVEKNKSKENYGQAGRRLYEQHCLSCHGGDRKGSGNYPSLLNVQDNYSTHSMIGLLNAGRRMMPAFKHLQEPEKEAITAYLLEKKSGQLKPYLAAPSAIDSFRNLPYSITGYYKFVSPEGLPAISPPWGTLTAIDLNTGEHRWQVPLGEHAELKARGIPPTGTENYGGPVVTAGGVLFIAASKDGKFRAFNKRTGELLWEYELPAAGFATPAIYSVKGKQYVVIACGGGKLRTRSGDAYIAFALPD